MHSASGSSPSPSGSGSSSPPPIMGSSSPPPIMENQRIPFDRQNGQQDSLLRGRARDIGSVLPNLTGRHKIILSHPSRPDRGLRFLSEIDGYLASYGFERQTGVVETVLYTYPPESAADRYTRTTPKLPKVRGDRVDGLHAYTYYMFLEALNQRLNMPRLDDVFGVNLVPLADGEEDQCLWMAAETYGIQHVYRRGTLSMDDYLLCTSED